MMRAMVLERPGLTLRQTQVPIPVPSDQQVLIKIAACGVCRTDLHVVDGELKEPSLPLIPGHQIVGTVEKLGKTVTGLQMGERVGVPWLGSTCMHCEYCLADEENLCDAARFTGYQINGGFAEYCVADARFCIPLSARYTDVQVAPLLCAGLIGYRAYKKAGKAKRIGIYGFGAAAHILVQVALAQGREIYAFTRPDDNKAQQFALKLGARWAGGSNESAPELLDAAIIFASDGDLVPTALRAIRNGGNVVCGGIYMSDIPSFPYEILWGERSISSVANLTRQDGKEFFNLLEKIPVKTEVHTYPLAKTNEALDDLRQGRFTGAAVVVPD